MSTRSRIAFVQGDGKVKSIYCHWDGYPEGVGKTLVKNYQDPKKVEELVGLGDISNLHDTIEETKPEVYDKDESSFREDDNINDFMKKLGCCGEEYTYIFDTDYTGVYTWDVVETPYPQNLVEKLQDIGAMEVF